MIGLNDFYFLVICIVYVKGPQKIFGPKAPRSRNPTLLVTLAYIFDRGETCRTLLARF